MAYHRNDIVLRLWWIMFVSDTTLSSFVLAFQSFLVSTQCDTVTLHWEMRARICVFVVVSFCCSVCARNK